MAIFMKYRYAKYWLIGMVVITNQKILLAQTDADNHRKYWYFKPHLDSRSL